MKSCDNSIHKIFPAGHYRRKVQNQEECTCNDLEDLTNLICCKDQEMLERSSSSVVTDFDMMSPKNHNILENTEAGTPVVKKAMILEKGSIEQLCEDEYDYDEANQRPIQLTEDSVQKLKKEIEKVQDEGYRVDRIIITEEETKISADSYNYKLNAKERYFCEPDDAYNPWYFGYHDLVKPENVTEMEHKIHYYQSYKLFDYEPLYFGHFNYEKEFKRSELLGINSQQFSNNLGFVVSNFTTGLISATALTGATIALSGANVASSISHRLFDRHN